LLVLGPAQALEVAAQQELAILLITREQKGYKTTINSYMQDYLLAP